MCETHFCCVECVGRNDFAVDLFQKDFVLIYYLFVPLIFIEYFLVLGSVLVSKERRTVRLYRSPKEIDILEGHSYSVLHAGLGKSMRSCVKI